MDQEGASSFAQTWFSYSESVIWWPLYHMGGRGT